MYLKKKDEQEYRKVRMDIAAGRLLTPDCLRMICEMYDHDPTKIGIHFLEMNARFKNEKQKG